MYSALVEEKATVDCFLLAQETAAPPKRKTKLVVYLLVSTLPPQSESQNSLPLEIFSKKDYKGLGILPVC
jgi:hypothetical protein